MKGIERIREFLGEFKTNYVIIGGTAVNLNLNRAALNERTTKDVDIIVICEALTSDYLARFWEMIRAGGYTPATVHVPDGTTRRVLYRFVNPTDPSFPDYIELFSRTIDDIPVPENMHPIHIDSEDEVSSISALLLNDDYYHYAVSHSFLFQLIAFRTLSAFTVNLAYNLEPVYSIAFAALLFGEYREVGFSFWLGIALIVLSVLIQTRRVL